MKINSEMRFPHPVLWAETADYTEGEFSVKVEVVEFVSTGAVRLKCDVVLTEERIRALCIDGRTSVGLSIVCLETYHNHLYEVPLMGGTLDIAPGLLRGVVRMRPIVWSNTAISSFASPNVHAEFGGGPFAFSGSSILALGDQLEIDVGAEKLAPMASLFTLAKDDAVPVHEVRAQIEDEKIQILANSTTLEWISQMRGNQQGKAILLNSIYLPVLMTVLDAIRAGDPVHLPKRWHRVISAKLTALGLKLDGDDLLLAAQTLLKSPLGKLESFVEIPK